MSGFWPHPWVNNYHRKESPCEEKSTPHGNSSLCFEKKENLSLKAEKASFYDLEEIEDFNNLNFNNLHWTTQKTPYGKKVNKRIYDADRKMFFYPKDQICSLF